MPKRDEKNVFAIGILTLPPSARALKMRSASASVPALRASAIPLKWGLPVQRPSDINSVVSPARSAACITLSAFPGEIIDWSGASLNRMSISTLAPIAFL